MAAATQPKTLQDIVLYEEDDLGRYSREEVLIAAGRWLPIGTVLGKRTDGKCVAFDPAATDGSQLPYGILLADTDAFADKAAVALVRHAIVKRQGLMLPASLDAAGVAALIDALQANGILVREAI